MTTTVRFAPSPTGLIHLGNARTALLNRCFARGRGGRFILRLDDTDRERSREAFAASIRADLAWIGILPDLEVRQSDRLDRYAAAAERLKAAGRLYPAYETEEELDRKRRLARAMHRPPVYDRAALELTPEQRAGLEAEGRRPHWRFRLEHRTMRWDDLVRGPQHIEAASLSDPVLLRGDGTPLYTFTSVVDDAELGVTHVIRGEDHVTNTAVQLQLFEALGWPPPAFAHHNLLTSASGAGLSKRDGSLSLEGLREAGVEATAVAAYAALVGSAEAVRPIRSLDDLAGLVDLARLSRAPAQVDEAELRTLSAKTLRELPFAAVSERLAALGVGGDEAFWLAVRGNCARLDEAQEWWRIATEACPPDETGALSREKGEGPFLRRAADALPPEPWNRTTWKHWTERLGSVTGRKGRALYHPLRQALTGRDTGPELAALLPFIGRERAFDRLTRPSAAPVD